jgi:NhaP-type Na+/H+ or K+/H+ antiporter
MAYPVDPAVGFGVLFGYFSLFGIPVGVAVGALVALALDRVSIRRSRAATVEHETVEPESHEGTLE